MLVTFTNITVYILFSNLIFAEHKIKRQTTKTKYIMKQLKPNMPPVLEKIPDFIKHGEIYHRIHRQLMAKWFRYFVMFFIFGSIFSIVYSSYEVSKPYRNYLFIFNYFASFVFTIEYALRLVSAPLQYTRFKKAWRARIHYITSFYGIIDFVAILPFVVIYLYKESPHVHIVVLAYILIIFKLIRYSRSFQMIGRYLKK